MSQNFISAKAFVIKTTKKQNKAKQTPDSEFLKQGLFEAYLRVSQSKQANKQTHPKQKALLELERASSFNWLIRRKKQQTAFGQKFIFQ